MLFVVVLVIVSKFCHGCMNGLEKPKFCNSGGSYTLTRGSEEPIKMAMTRTSQTCLWLGNRDSRVCTAVLTCNLFNVKYSANCEQDYLEVLDGNVMRVKYCGSSTNLRYEAKGVDVFDVKSSIVNFGEFNCKVFCKEDETPKIISTTTSTTKFVPSKAKCGRCGHSKVSGRIVNGNDVEEPGTYPWQGILTVNGRFACGCTLITPLHVLTAAHCTYGRSPSVLGLIFGRHNFTLDNTEASEQRRNAVKITQHPQLNVTKLDFDFSIIKLDSPISITDYVEPACLPRDGSNDYGGGTHAIVTGWGSLQASEMRRPEILQQIKIPTWNKNTCGNFKPTQITENMLCAGGEEKDACQGDSGGPLVTLNGNDLYVLIGVTSWGIGCATPGYPGVYARVTSALPWIRKEIPELDCI